MSSLGLGMQRASESRLARMRRVLVHGLYASHSRSRAGRTAIATVLSQVSAKARVLNVGAGDSLIRPGVINVDIYRGRHVSCLASGERLPFAAATFECVISQETFEHIRNPDAAVSEVHRVLIDGGAFFCQVPFIIGYHPGPTDYWRFTVEGIREIVERAGFRVDEIGMTLGPAYGAYYVLVELFAVAVSGLNPRLYLPAKGLAAIALTPLRWFDPILSRLDQAKRIAAGHYVVARKMPASL